MTESHPRRRASDRRLILYPLLAVLLTVAVLAFLVFRHFFAVLTVAASVSLLLGPVQRRVTRACRGRAGFAAGLLVLLTAVLILVPVLTSAALLSQQAVGFFEWLRPRVQPDALQQLWQETLPRRLPWLQGYLRFDEAEASQAVSGLLSRLAGGANRLVQGVLAGLGEALFELAVFLLALFFLLRDGRRLRDEIQSISPLSAAQEEEIFDHLARTVKGVLKAMVVVPLAQGLVAFFGFLAFGVPSPVLWSVLVVLAALVPIVGSPAGWIPAVVYLLIRGETWQWAGLLAYGVVLISGIDNVIKPLLLKEAARIHPMLGFLAILGGVLSFGPLGFLIGPVILSLVLSAIRIYRSDVLRPHATAPAAEPPAEGAA